jgi:hypothetical protein
MNMDHNKAMPNMYANNSQLTDKTELPIVFLFSVGLHRIRSLNIYYKHEGHDGPEVAHLYIGPRSGASLNPRAII